MKTKSIILIASAGMIAAACVPQEERDLYRPGAYVEEGIGYKAFADAVIAHCVPAIQNEEAFADFEMKNASPLRALADNKYPVVSRDGLPIWQLAEGLVQVQLDPYTTCEAVAVGLPMDTTIEVTAKTAKANGFSEIDADSPADGASIHRVLVAADGTTLDLTAPVEGQTPDGRTYTKVVATVSQGAD